MNTYITYITTRWDMTGISIYARQSNTGWVIPGLNGALVR